jgi:glutamate racemase
MHALVVDWGIGGVDAWQRLRARCPGWSTTYVSDSGFAPWGRVPAETLAARLQCLVAAVTAVLRQQGDSPPDLLIVACNAMSTVLDPTPSISDPTFSALGRDLGLATFGVITPGIAMCDGPWRRIGIIGGQRTIAAGLHEAGLRERGFDTVAVAAQPLSAHVEAGRLAGPEVENDIAAVVAALCAHGAAPDALLLACTHYPALAAHFRRLLPTTVLLDPVDALLDAVLAANIKAAPALPAQHRAFTTGDPDATAHAAELAFGARLPTPITPLPSSLIAG